MNFWTRAEALLAVAAWAPVLAGLIGRAAVFERDKNEGAPNPDDAIPDPEDTDFAIPNQEPEPKGENERTAQ